MAVSPRYSVNNSDIRSVSGFQPSTVSRLLRGRFRFRSAGRNSCGTFDSGSNFFVFRSPEGKIFSRDQHHCNSISSCSACRQRRLLQRGKEIQAVIDLFLSGVDLPLDSDFSGREVYLLTLTVPHHFSDKLSDLLGKTKFSGLRAARSYFFSQSRFRHYPGFLGWIAGIECQLGGSNGFHPHLHALVFLDTVDVEHFRSEALRYWQRACEKFGLRSPSAEFGVDLRQGQDAAFYISKFAGGEKNSSTTRWSVAAELADAGYKKSDYSLSISQAEQEFLHASGSERSRLWALLNEYYREFYAVKIHTFSRFARFLRSIHLKTQISVQFAQVFAQVKSGESVSDINSIGFDQFTDLSSEEFCQILPGTVYDESQFFDVAGFDKKCRELSPDVQKIERDSALFAWAEGHLWDWNGILIAAG